MGLYALKDDYQKAADDCRSSLRLNPSNANLCNLFAVMLASCPDASVRNGKEAVDFARKACELTEWKDPGYLVTLAAAYAESGDFEQALKYQKYALAMSDWPEPARIILQHRLDLYQQGKPFHEAPSQ